jgi:DNA-cytosine methyltransferase
MTLRHASFFSGVGGLDLGFHRAGIETVSFSEIDPYASTVLGERFPEVPNLGDISRIDAKEVPNAEVWSGGFPCQDLSVAGRRKGFEDGTRSSLAFTYLDLVERRRPRWVVLENVPGLFSSNGGRDFARLIREMVDLGYGLSWRTLDARFFGVPQRRRRVFIVAANDEAFGGFGAERAAEVLLECEGVCGHIGASAAEGKETPRGAQDRARGDRERDDAERLDSEAYSDGVRASNGLARRVDDVPNVETFGAETHRALQARDWKVGVGNQDIGEAGYLVGTIQDAREMKKSQNGIGVTTEDVGYTLTRSDHQAVAITGSLTGGGKDSPQSGRVFSDQGFSPTLDTGRAVPQVFRMSARVSSPGSPETWVDDGLANTLNSFDVGDIRTTHAVISEDVVESGVDPAYLDGHRYRCAGNGVVANVAEWIGRRIVQVDEKYSGEAE